MHYNRRHAWHGVYHSRGYGFAWSASQSTSCLTWTTSQSKSWPGMECITVYVMPGMQCITVDVMRGTEYLTVDLMAYHQLLHIRRHTWHDFCIIVNVTTLHLLYQRQVMVMTRNEVHHSRYHAWHQLLHNGCDGGASFALQSKSSSYMKFVTVDVRAWH